MPDFEKMTERKNTVIVRDKMHERREFQSDFHAEILSTRGDLSAILMQKFQMFPH
jgi:hypothetical protein